MKTPLMLVAASDVWTPIGVCVTLRWTAWASAEAGAMAKAAISAPASVLFGHGAGPQPEQTTGVNRYWLSWKSACDSTQTL